MVQRKNGFVTCRFFPYFLFILILNSSSLVALGFGCFHRILGTGRSGAGWDGILVKLCFSLMLSLIAPHDKKAWWRRSQIVMKTRDGFSLRLAEEETGDGDPEKPAFRIYFKEDK